MPHQVVGPQLHLARPKTHHGFPSSSARPGRRNIHRAKTSSATKKPQNAQPGDGEYQIELLEYEWPDLPPIIDMKDAVTRRRVSKGIDYLLPVDKGRNSINSKFRTDLRAMFQEPYAVENASYDETRVVKSAKVHFKTNVVNTKWTEELAKSIPVNLNSESEKVRKLYAHSAPAGGRSRSTNVDSMKTRSSLFLPIKSTAHPEASKLRKEVENIIKSVQEDNDEYDDNDGAATEATHTEKDGGRSRTESRKSILQFRAMSIFPTDESSEAEQKNKFPAANFDSYEQLKQSKPKRPAIPEEFRSEFLSEEKSQEIWDWLHYGETISDFEYFLSVCG